MTSQFESDRPEYAELRSAVVIQWLRSAEEPPGSSPADRAFVSKLVALYAARFQFAYRAGLVACGRCVFSSGPSSIEIDGASIDVRSRDVLVPGEGVLYLAPSMVLHWIDAHGFVPPQPFVRAVMACEIPGTFAYFAQVRAAGAVELVRRYTAERLRRARGASSA